MIAIYKANTKLYRVLNIIVKVNEAKITVKLKQTSVIRKG